MADAIMKAKKQKGKVHYKKDKMSNPELATYDGCKGCDRVCIFKGKIVHPKESFSVIFLCNSIRKVK